MYYHVLIKILGNDRFRLLFKDLNKQELKKKAIRPFSYGKPLLSNGQIVKPSDISVIEIRKTPQIISEILSEIAEQDIEKQKKEFEGIAGGDLPFGFLPNVGVRDIEIRYYSQDMTRQFIVNHPGSKRSPFGLFASISNNPWLVAIGGAILAALLINLIITS